MLSVLKNLLSSKVGVRITMRGNLSAREGLTIQAIVQSARINGFMRIIPGNLVQIDLEGPKSKLESLVHQLRSTQIGTGRIFLETIWKPFKAEFHQFRAAL